MHFFLKKNLIKKKQPLRKLSKEVFSAKQKVALAISLFICTLSIGSIALNLSRHSENGFIASIFHKNLFTSKDQKIRVKFTQKRDESIVVFEAKGEDLNKNPAVKITSLLNIEKKSNGKNIESLIKKVLNTEENEQIKFQIKGGSAWKRDGAYFKKEGINKGTDIRYKLMDNGIKEEIILNSCEGNDLCKTGEIEIGLTVTDGIIFTKEIEKINGKDGRWVFFDNRGNYIAHFERPFAIDGNGERTDAVRLNVKNNQVNIYLDRDWINFENRKFPIVIDPTIVHDTEAEFNLAYSQNRVVTTSSPEISLKDVTNYSNLRTALYLKFDETVNDSCLDGKDACDSSSYINNATEYNTTISTGIFGNARNFNGTNSYITVEHKNELMPVQDFSWSFWVKPNNDVNQGYFRKYDTYSGNGYYINYYDKRVYLTQGRQGTLNQVFTEQNILRIGSWNHIAIIKKGAHVAIYVNGIESQRGYLNSFQDFMNSSSNLYIGSHFTDGQYLNGSMDEIAMFNFALTSDQVKALYNKKNYGIYTSEIIDLNADIGSINKINWIESKSQTGSGETNYSDTNLIAKWDFNEVNGTILNNTAGVSSCGGIPSNCNGLLYNFNDTSGQDKLANSGWTSKYKKWGNGAITFDGQDDYIKVPHRDVLNPGINSFTITAWVKINWFPLPDDFPTFIRKNDGDMDNGYFISISNTNEIRFAVDTFNGPVYQAISPPNIPLGQWLYVAGVLDRSDNKVKLYIDGALVASVPGPGSGVINPSSDLVFGYYNRWQGNEFGAFTVDSISIFNRALSQDEIIANSQNTDVEFQTRTGTDTTPEDGGWEDWKSSTTNPESSISTFEEDTASWQSYGSSSGGYGISVLNTKITIPNGPAGCEKNEAIAVSNFGNTENLTDYHVEINIDYDSGMNSDFSNLRFTDSNGNNLDYFIYSYNASKNANVFVKVPTLNANSQIVIFLWYSNCTGGISSNTNGLIYDDMETDSWTYSENGSPWTGEWNNSEYKSSNHSYGIYYPAATESLTGYYGRFSKTFSMPIGQKKLKVSYKDSYTGDVSGYHYLQVKIGGAVYFDKDVYGGTTEWSTTPFINFNNDTESKIIDMQIFEKNGVTNWPINAYWDDLLILKATFPEPKVNFIIQDNSISIEGNASTMIKSVPQCQESELSLYYSLNETGGNYIDKSGKGNTGIAGGTNALSSVKGISENAVKFDGTNYIDLGTDSSLNLGDKATIMFWMKQNMTSGNAVGLVTIGAGNNKYSVTLSYNDVSKIGFAVNGNWYWNAGNRINDNLWHHIVAVRDENNIKIFIDGIPKTYSTGTAYTSSYNRIGIGYYGSFVGVIDEVKVYNRALSNQEISEAYKLGEGRIVKKSLSFDASSKNKLSFFIAGDRPGNYLSMFLNESSSKAYKPDSSTIAMWNLDEISTGSSIIEDNSGNGHNGVEVNTKDSEGIFGRGKSFNGSNYINIGNYENLNFERTDSFTLEAWVKTTSNQFGAILSKMIAGGSFTGYDIAYCGNLDWGSGCNQYSLKIHLINSWPGNSISVATKTRINDGKWHYIALTYEGTSSVSGLSIYIDGVKQPLSIENNNLTGSIKNSYDFRIGSRHGDCFFQGFIDEVRVSSGIRSADEIYEIFQQNDRKYDVSIDFAAVLDNSNLINATSTTFSNDYSFTINEKIYGRTNNLENLYKGDNIIIRENFNGIIYTAQGVVNSVNSNGAVTVASWKNGSTFPDRGGGVFGFGVNADVFKWQREFFDLRHIRDDNINSVAEISFMFTNGIEGRNVWIDDLKSITNYLTIPDETGNVISAPYRYFQYRIIFSSNNSSLSSSISEVSIDYSEITVNDNAPVFLTDPYEYPVSISSSPTNSGQTILFKTTATDADNNRYYLAVCSSDNIIPGSWTAPSCGDTTYCVSSDFESGTESSCSYQTKESDSETNNWFAFVCDMHTNSKCSLSSQGSGDSGSPFKVNHKPFFVSVTDDGGGGSNSGADPGGVMQFSAIASDGDNDGENDEVRLVVCGDNFGATQDGCIGIELCKSSFLSSNPSCNYNIPWVNEDGEIDFYAYIFDSHGHGSASNYRTGTYKVNNIAPQISNLILNSSNDISLTVGSTKDVLFSLTVSDDNSCQDLSQVKGSLYRSGIGFSNCDSLGEANDNNCYPEIECIVDTGTCSGKSDPAANYTCRATVKYFADPTDDFTQYPSENWKSSVVAKDNSFLTDEEESVGVEVQSLNGFSVSSAINYGTLKANENTHNSEIKIEVINSGNTGLDFYLSGTNLTYGSYIIPVSNQKYSSVLFDYELAGTVLTDTPTLFELHLLKTINSSNPSKKFIYWGIGIPAVVGANTYSGYNTIESIKSNPAYW